MCVSVSFSLVLFLSVCVCVCHIETPQWVWTGLPSCLRSCTCYCVSLWSFKSQESSSDGLCFCLSLPPSLPLSLLSEPLSVYPPLSYYCLCALCVCILTGDALPHTHTQAQHPALPGTAPPPCVSTLLSLPSVFVCFWGLVSPRELRVPVCVSTPSHTTSTADTTEGNARTHTHTHTHSYADKYTFACICIHIDIQTYTCSCQNLTQTSRWVGAVVVCHPSLDFWSCASSGPSFESSSGSVAKTGPHC